MKNSKVIILNGFTRGGTNITWNILQSHPQVCSAIVETAPLVYRDTFRLPAQIARNILSCNSFYRSPMGFISAHILDNLFYQRKLDNYTYIDNSTKYDLIPYVPGEIEQSTLCLKSVDWDIKLTDYFNFIYENSFFIGLIRNGYAICNGWMRRGKTAEDAGKAYLEIGEKMLEYSQSYENYKIIRFEDVLVDPFSAATELFKFADLDPIYLEKIRLKAKRVMSVAGSHSTRQYEEGRKYWMTPSQIVNFLDQKIDNLQASLLSESDRQSFEKYAKPILEHFDYH